jgi:undecaprenyl diphosphate synthase
MEQSALLVPPHVAIIMDGNGRWAAQRGQRRSSGHRAGARVVRDVVEHCAALGVQQLTLYAFSSDNWNRPQAEVQALLVLFTAHFRSEADALARAGVQLTVIGRRERLPLLLRAAIRDAEQRTQAGRRMHLRVALDYSSRAAIMRAHPSSALQSASLDAGDLLPPVDMLIRTGGERRLSDFLLWECAYAELLFLDLLWPDVTAATLDDAFADFAHRDRRYGRVSAQVSA